MSNSQQIITAGLDTLHRRHRQTSVIIVLMDTLIYFQKSYVQPDMHLHYNSINLNMNKGIHTVVNQK